MADADAILAAQQAAAADRQEPLDAAARPVDDGPDDERQEAIHEILAELRDDDGPDTEPEPEPPADEQPQAAPQPPELPADEPPAPEPVPPSPPEPEAAAPASRPPASPAVPRLGLGAAWSSHGLMLLHACFLAVLTAAVWLGHRQMAATLALIQGRAAQGAGEASEPDQPTRRAQTSTTAHASLVPRPDPPPPVLSVDEGLQYTQAAEQADVLFEKGDYAAAAAAYTRALAAMPASWDDGACAYRLGECYLRQGDPLRAIGAFERVARSYPSQYKPRALYQLGEAHLKLGAFTKARQAFHELLLLQARYGDQAKSHVQRAYYRIADCYRLEAESLEGGGKEGSR